jgi:hypothetical protein
MQETVVLFRFLTGLLLVESQLIAAASAVSSPLGVKRAALTASEVHLSREPIGKHRAEHQDATQHGYRYERV